MKKFLSLILCLVLSVISTGCRGGDDGNGSYTLICPDGAPALATYALSDYDGISSTVYSSAEATASIIATMADNSADFAILPVNLATKTANNDGYKMLGVLTHGNLYAITKDDIALTPSALKGKRVGVIQLGAVPGYTVKSMLSFYGVEYTQSESSLTDDNVYLRALTNDKSTIVTALDEDVVDIAIVAEPLCSDILDSGMYYRGMDIQSVYGFYPQAVLMAKTDIILNDSETVKTIMDKLAAFVFEDIDAQAAVATINSYMYGEGGTMLNANTLTYTALVKSNIRFSPASWQKENVKQYINDLKQFNTELGKVVFDVTDDFFYIPQ